MCFGFPIYELQLLPSGQSADRRAFVDARRDIREAARHGVGAARRRAMEHDADMSEHKHERRPIAIRLHDETFAQGWRFNEAGVRERRHDPDRATRVEQTQGLSYRAPVRAVG